MSQITAIDVFVVFIDCCTHALGATYNSSSTWTLGWTVLQRVVRKSAERPVMTLLARVLWPRIVSGEMGYHESSRRNAVAEGNSTV